MKKKQSVVNSGDVCRERIRAIRDTMEILAGKWKIHILGTLMQNGGMRFMDLMREVDGIAAKMLSKELHDLEMNRLITRTVHDTRPVTVEYSVTEYGQTLAPVIDEIAAWGIGYRKRMYAEQN